MPPAYQLTGWRRQPHDPRDRLHKVSRSVLAALPPYADLAADFPLHLDQGSLGSCGPHTAAEMVYWNLLQQGQPAFVPSRLHVYYWTRTLMGTVGTDSGVDNRSLFKALERYGYCNETLWPYAVGRFRDQPPQAANQAALANRVADYAAVPKAHAQMQGTLAGGDPFCFGFDVYQGLMSDQAAETGIVPLPRPGETPLGGHDVAFFGYTTVDRPGVRAGNKWPAGTYKFLNHWTNPDGSPWGDGGYGYLSTGFCVSPAASDFWVVNTVPGGPPAPPTPVPPGPPPPKPPEPTMTNYLLTAKGRLFGIEFPITGLITPAPGGTAADLVLPPEPPRGLADGGAADDIPRAGLLDAWRFVVRYWNLLEPYLAAHGKTILRVVATDLLAGKTDPKLILADVMAAILAESPPPGR